MPTNLFQPGNKLSVGNPGPGPRPDILTQALISQINEIDNRDPQKRAKIAKMVDKLIAMGIDGDMDAIKFIWDRVEGPVKTVNELRNADGGTFKLEVIRHVIVDPDMKTIEGDVEVS